MPVASLDEIRARVGEEIGVSSWLIVDQARIDAFAEATEDRQFIHTDPAAAAQTVFGGTIAHGFLTLSLLSRMGAEAMLIPDGLKMAVNYGLDRVRFPAPLPVGAQWRGGAEIVEVTDVPGGVQVKTKVTVEVKDQEKPACVAECLARIYG